MYNSIVLRCIHTPLYHILNFNLQQQNIKIDYNQYKCVKHLQF
jgi:hypothetical protein